MSKKRNVVLTEEMIKQRTRLPLKDVKNLNMWGYDLSDLSIVDKMPNLEVISLSLNKISSLGFFKNLEHLRDLFLRNNQISDFKELQNLKGLKELKTLWLSENPIASDPQYRLRVIHELPNLTKLDEADITEEEKSEAKKITAIVDKTKDGDTSPTSSSSGHSSHSKRILKLPSSTSQRVRKTHKENDEPLMTAILALLPELSNDSLDVVINKVLELKK